MDGEKLFMSLVKDEQSMLGGSKPLMLSLGTCSWGRGEGGRLGNREEEFSVNRGGAIPLHAPDPHPVDFGPPLRSPSPPLSLLSLSLTPF